MILKQTFFSQQNIQTSSFMPPAQPKIPLTKTSPLSVVKLNYTSESPDNLNKINISTPSHLQSALSPDLNFSPSSSPRVSKTSQNWNTFNKFFKKQIQMHEKQLKKNPRIKLIQNTRKIISNRHPSFEKYILHSTKKLKIISNNIHTERSHKEKSFALSQTGPIPYFISLSEHYDPTDERMAESMDQRRRKSSQEGKRIYKGITSRKGNRLGRFSLELEKYKSSEQQNEEDFEQHKKINLYQSLIYGEHLKAKNLMMPVTESLGGEYSRIDRSKSPPTLQAYPRQRGSRSRQATEKLGLKQYMLSGFPAKKVQKSEPQVLTIHIKRPQNKFRSSLMTRQDKPSGHYYHPRPIPISNINIFKRPNTTFANGSRRDSEIQPW